MGRKLTNEEFQKRLKELRENGIDVFSNDVYTGSHKDIDFYCSKGHRWPAMPVNVFHKGCGCPYCSGRYPIVGKTDLWTTHPEVARLLVNQNEGHLYSAHSETETGFVCPDCGSIIIKKIRKVTDGGLACKVCSDGISYPNKFARELLNQLCIGNVEYEYSPQWLRPYHYDNYFELNDKKYVLEMDGGLGHGNNQFGTNEKDTIGLQRDCFKDDLAVQHNINVIRIDCHYKNHNRFEYIRSNILLSLLSVLFDLSDANWTQCHQFATSSLMMKAARYYDDGMGVGDIAQKMNYHPCTITAWLKQMASVNLCSYTVQDSRKRGCNKLYRPATSVKQYTKNHEYITTFAKVIDAEIQTGVDHANIVACCKGRISSAGGYWWTYTSID